MKDIDQLKKIKIPLAEALLKCPGMMDRSTRNDIVGMLDDKIRTTMNRSDVSRADVMNILNRCLEFSDGMESLMTALRFMETEDADCMAGVKNLVYED